MEVFAKICQISGFKSFLFNTAGENNFGNK
jgi:hypothetical protein